MATTINAGSLFLAAATPRLLTQPNSAILVSTTAPIFHVNTSGTPDTTSVLITAQLISLSGTVTFSITGGTLSSISGNTAVLTYANMSSNLATITATLVYRGNTFTSTTNISKVFDGATGSTGIAGSRGAGTYYATGSAWDDTVANIATPGSNVTDDLVTISNGSTYALTKRWDGSAWVSIGTVVDGNLLVTGSVSAPKINANGLSIRKADGTLILDASGSGLQTGFEAPGTKNSDLTSSISAAALLVFSPLINWEFRNTLNGWGFTGGTTTQNADSVTFTANTTDSNINMALTINGTLYDKVRMRVRRIAGSGWQGQVYYATASHGASESYTKIVAADPTVGGAWTIIEWDMANLTNGGTDWVGNTITGLRIDLGNSTSDAFEIDWITAGKYGPPPSESTVTAAATTATWTGVSGTGKPSDNATVGAPSGTNVGSTSATTVESNAANGASAYTAVNDSTTGLAQRMRANADNVLGGIISANAVSAPAGFRAGTLTWDASGTRTGGYGVAITPKGLVGYTSAGVQTFIIDATNGGATFAGTLNVQSATSGARTEIVGDVIRVYDTSNVLRVKIGNLA